MTKKRIPTEALIDIQQRLGQLPSRCSERRQIIQEVAHLYGVSEHTIYRALRERNQLHSTKRTDSGQPRVIHRRELGSAEKVKKFSYHDDYQYHFSFNYKLNYYCCLENHSLTYEYC
jgi:hypothetical protein